MNNSDNNLSIINTIDLFNNLIDNIVTNLEYIELSNKKFRFKIANNKYVIDIFDFCINEDNLKDKTIEKIDNLHINSQLDALIDSIDSCLDIEDYNKLYNLHKTIKNIVTQYKNYFDYPNNYSTELNTVMNNLSNNLLNLSKVQLLDGSLSSKFENYYNKSNNIITSSKYIYKFQDIITNNISELKNIDINLGKKLEEKELKKFIDKFTPIYDNEDNKDDNEDNTTFKKSIEVFYSVLSLTDWFEEMRSKGILGLIIRVASPNIAKIGYNLNSIEIKDITTTLAPLQNILEAADFYYSKHNRLDHGLEYNSMIEGNAIGSGNAILPLYICKENWKLSSLYLKPALGIMICQNPTAYNKKHILFIFTLFLDMVTRTFKSDRQNVNKKWIQLLFSVYRTCVEISKENNFDRGIIGIYKKYMANPLNRTKNIVHSIYSILGQMLVTDIYINNLTKFIELVFEEKVRRRIYTFLDKYIDITHFMDTINDDFIIFDNKKLDLLNDKFNSEADEICENIASFCKFYTLIKQFTKKYKGFHNFINELDNNFSILNDQDMDICQNFINKNINNENTTMDDIYKFTNSKPNEDFYKKCVLQGLDQKNNKIRCKYINNGYYVHLNKISYKNLCNNILTRHNRNKKKILTSIKYIKHNNILINNIF